MKSIKILKKWKRILNEISPGISFRINGTLPYIVGYCEESDISFRISYSGIEPIKPLFVFHMESKGHNCFTREIEFDEAESAFKVYCLYLKDMIEFGKMCRKRFSQFPKLSKPDNRSLILSELIDEINENI
jgi:hypothetical protein